MQEACMHLSNKGSTLDKEGGLRPTSWKVGSKRVMVFVLSYLHWFRVLTEKWPEVDWRNAV